MWLFEEMGWPYKLVFKQGDLAGSMANIRAISPIVPMAPTLQYGDQVLVESGAIIETLINRHAPGALQPPLASRDYPYHMIFMHYAEGSLASRLFSDYRAWQIQPPTARSPLVDSEAVVQYADEHLAKHPWFGGPAFSTADIMMKFPLDVATDLNLVDVGQFPRVAAWKKTIEARPAYIRMRAKALPKGMVGNLTPLPKHALRSPPCPQGSGAEVAMRAELVLTLALLAATPALAQPSTSPAPPKIRVPFGDTALVDNPCPPAPPPLVRLQTPPGQPAQYEPASLAAYRAYADWRQANDWAYLCRYRAENQALAAAHGRPTVVFMGDSITENWARLHPEFFVGGRTGRGISGQTSPQMLTRFYQDVVALHPRVVHIMAGTNDVAGNTGPTTDADFKANITAMVDLAQANHIAVILASIPPAKAVPWSPALKPSPKIVELNGWLRDLARTRHLTYADYYAALVTDGGALRPEWTSDGVHPTAAGYAAMEPVALKAIAAARR